MIKIENEEVYGWDAAIRGMRNPMNSWDKSDSGWMIMNEDDHELGYDPNYEYVIGEKDAELMCKLSKAGDDHSKFLRMVNVTVDITAPLYWWKEFDTYKVGTVANSCSTMHNITNKEFTIDDFSHEHCDGSNIIWQVVAELNVWRKMYLEGHDKYHWWQIIQLLPSSYNQKRTIQLNYQVLRRMYKARCNHKLDEWRDFCKWTKELPYFEEIVLNRKWTLDTFAEPQ